MAHRRGWEREGLAHGRRGYDSEGRAGHGGPLSHTRCLGDVTASGGRIPLGLQGRHGSHGADMAGTRGSRFRPTLTLIPPRMRILGLLRNGGKRTVGQISAQTGIAPGGRRCFSSCAVSVSRLPLARPCIGNASSSEPKVHPGSRTRPRLKRGQPRASSTGRKGARPQRLRC